MNSSPSLNILKQYPDLTIELTSHTDTRGTAEYNMELSERRSESSKSYLVLLGIDASRIITKGSRVNHLHEINVLMVCPALKQNINTTAGQKSASPILRRGCK